MRVLHVITGLRLGGAERQVFEHATRSRYDVEVAALYDVGEVGDALRSRGIRVHDLAMRSNRDVTLAPRLAHLIRRERYDVVHVHLYRACVYGRIAARWAGHARIVTTEHSLGTRLIEGRHAGTGVRALYLLTSLLSDCTIAVSTVVRERLIAWGVAADKIVVIPNGVDLASLTFDPWRRARARAELGIAEHERVVGTIGRLVASKGYDRVLRAFAMIPGAPRLVVVGDGPERESIERDARRLGVADRTLLLSARPVGALLDTFDAFVAASEPGEETFGLAPVEALANGLPCVITYCPALEGHLHPRVIRTSPDVASLAGALSTALWTDRGTTPAFLDEFAIDRVVTRIDDLYADPRVHQPSPIGRKV